MLPTIELSISPKLHGYLMHLARCDHGYGDTPERVAIGLIWREIERLRSIGVLSEAHASLTAAAGLW
jgi:hypothetical protein